MTPKTRKDVADLRAATRLLVDATLRVSKIVETMHRTIGSGPRVLGRPLALPMSLITAVSYGVVRGVTSVAGRGIDAALKGLGPLMSEREPGPERLAMVSALNGVLGDYLAQTHNALAFEMQLYGQGGALQLDSASLRAAFPKPGGRLLVLVHGSCMNEQQWYRHAHDHGAALARDEGFTPIYVRYNSGLHISTNGHLLAARLEHLAQSWPVKIETLTLLCHSMGGLVARGACRIAELEGLQWRKHLAAMVTLGTPHHGAPLERAGNWVTALLGVSDYSAPLAQLARIRSAGVTDLRFGNVLDEHWAGGDRFALGPDTRTPVPLPEGVECFAVAGTRSTKKGGARLRSDGMVPVDSALGRHTVRAHALGFEKSHQYLSLGTDHWNLLSALDVYEMLRRWLGAPRTPGRP